MRLSDNKLCLSEIIDGYILSSKELSKNNKKEYAMIKKIFSVAESIMIIVLLTLPVIAREIGGINMPEGLNAGKQQLILNGAGVREKFFLDIYSIGLYLIKKNQNAQKIMEMDEPMAIKMHIVSRMVTPEKMARNVNDGFVRSTGGNIASIKDRNDKMISVFKKGIKKGDIYELIYMPKIGVRISKNGKLKQTIKGLDFKKALFGIWIADPPLSETLKDQMLGNIVQ